MFQAVFCLVKRRNGASDAPCGGNGFCGLLIAQAADFVALPLAVQCARFSECKTF